VQKGLATLVRSAPPDRNVDYLTGRAKAFYFSKKTGMNVSWDEVQAHAATAEGANHGREDDKMRTPSAIQPEPDVQLSIAELTRLIESGATHLIPYTEVIPERLNEAPQSKAQAPQREKPWEKNNITEEEFRSDSPALVVSTCGVTPLVLE